jgi:glycosyltransferase involved in cell wall biosynthesis
MSAHSVDIAHLAVAPLFAPGSYNYMAPDQAKFLPEFSQVVLSFWDQPIPDTAYVAPYDLLIDGKGLTLKQRLILAMPQRVRRLTGLTILDDRLLKYLWGCLRELRRLKPRVIHVYDLWKMGPILRKEIDWPCRLVLSEHGLSYFLSRPESSIYLLLNAYDAIWSLTNTSYMFNYRRTVKYCPLVTVLPHWYDLDRYRPVTAAEKASMKDEWNIGHDRKVVLLLSRRVPEKGAHLILYSWKKILERVPNALLWIVGSGPVSYLEYLQRMVTALGVSDSVRIEGYIPDERKPSCYQAAEAYVFPTLHTEGWAMSLSEAMACGIPCISSEFAVIHDLYYQGELLFVPDPNIADVFVEPVVRALTDEPLRASLAARGAVAIKTRFNREQAMDKIRDFYSRQIKLTRE